MNPIVFIILLIAAYALGVVTSWWFDSAYGPGKKEKRWFAERIEMMNRMYKLRVLYHPGINPAEAVESLTKFKATLLEEVFEVDPIISAIDCMNERGNDMPKHRLEALVAIADWLGDLVIYCRSEAMKYGIPLEDVLDIIMDSNESKLGLDGQPIYNENGKFMKGPNYWAPEEQIRLLLQGPEFDSPAQAAMRTDTH